MLLLTLACAGKAGDSAPTDDGLPHIVIDSPHDGDTVGTCFTMEVEVRNFEIVAPQDHPDPVDGEGHWQIVFTDRSFFCESLACAVNLAGLDDGATTLVAQLFGNDYVPLEDPEGGPVQDTVDVVVSGSTCGTGA